MKRSVFVYIVLHKRCCNIVGVRSSMAKASLLLGSIDSDIRDEYFIERRRLL